MKFYRTEINAEHRTLQSPPCPPAPLVCIISSYTWVLVKVFYPFLAPVSLVDFIELLGMVYS